MHAEIARQLRQDRANASLYRAIKRLEAYGLIRRMPERGGLQLTELGIKVAKSFESPTSILSTIDPVTSFYISRRQTRQL